MQHFKRLLRRCFCLISSLNYVFFFRPRTCITDFNSVRLFSLLCNPLLLIIDDCLEFFCLCLFHRIYYNAFTRCENFQLHSFEQMVENRFREIDGLDPFNIKFFLSSCQHAIFVYKLAIFYPKTGTVFINKIKTPEYDDQQQEYATDSKKPRQRYIPRHDRLSLIEKYNDQRDP